MTWRLKSLKTVWATNMTSNRFINGYDASISDCSDHHIRFALPADAEKLLKIYAQYIATPVTFECALPTDKEFAGRIQSISAEYPYLIYEISGLPIGYAYAHRMGGREAYQWNAELSIYLDSAYTSKGIGKKLYVTLIAILKLQSIKTVYGVVTVPNEKSEKLHMSLGFRKIGTHRKTGFKCGAWQDVAWFEKHIAPLDDHPAPFLSIRHISKSELSKILNQ